MGYQRSKAQREADRTETGRLWCRGYTEQEIANKLEVSQTTICKDLAAIKEEWRKQVTRDRIELLRDEIAKLDHLEHVAWMAWEASQQEKETQSSESVLLDQLRRELEGAVDGGMAGGRRLRSSIKKESRDGSVAFVRLAFECIKQRCLLYGLAPKDSIDNVVAEKVEAEFENLMLRFEKGLPDEVKPLVFEAANAAVDAIALLPVGG